MGRVLRGLKIRNSDNARCSDCFFLITNFFLLLFSLFFTRAAVVDSSVRVPYRAQPRRTLDGVAKFLLLKTVVTIEIENF
jgi:hypothetical protein